MKKKTTSRTKTTDDGAAVQRRINKLIGQLEGIGRMLEDGRAAQDVLTQCKAVHAGLRSIEAQVLYAHTEEALTAISGMQKRGRDAAMQALVGMYRPY